MFKSITDKKFRRRHSILKKISFILLFIITLVFITYIIKTSNKNSSTKIVCPNNSNDKRCQYFGANGLQQAVNDSSSKDKTMIKIKKGTYSKKENFAIPLSSLFTVSTFLKINNKNILIEGENSTYFDGDESTDMSGIAITDGDVEIKNIIIKGFRGRLDNCATGIIVFRIIDSCTYGNTVEINGKGKVKITNTQILNSKDAAIYINNTSSLILSNNIIVDSRYGIQAQNIRHPVTITMESNLIKNYSELAIYLTTANKMNLSIIHNTFFRQKIDNSFNSAIGIDVGISATYNSFSNSKSDFEDVNKSLIIVEKNIFAQSEDDFSKSTGVFGLGDDYQFNPQFIEKNNIYMHKQHLFYTGCEDLNNPPPSCFKNKRLDSTELEFKSPETNDFHVINRNLNAGAY